MNNIAYNTVINKNLEEYSYIGDRYMTNKSKKSKPIYTYHNPNTPEETKKLLKNIIIKILINKKGN